MGELRVMGEDGGGGYLFGRMSSRKSAVLCLIMFL